MRCLISGSEQPSYQAGDRRGKLSAQLHINHHHHHENFAKRVECFCQRNSLNIYNKVFASRFQTIPVDPQTVEKLSDCQFQNQHQFSQVLSKILISHSHTIQATKESVIPHICHRHHRRCLCKKNCPV